jgi:hypothetical protein
MCCNDFDDAREFFSYVNKLMEQKIADNSPLLEKILLIKNESLNDK